MNRALYSGVYGSLSEAVAVRWRLVVSGSGLCETARAALLPALAILHFIGVGHTRLVSVVQAVHSYTATSSPVPSRPSTCSAREHFR